MDVTMRNTIATVEFKELSAGTDTALDWKESDDKTILVIKAETTGTKLTVKAGNGIQGGSDTTYSIPKGISMMKLESGRFKHVSGVHKGKMILNSTAAVSVGIVALI